MSADSLLALSLGLFMGVGGLVIYALTYWAIQQPDIDE